VLNTGQEEIIGSFDC